MEDPRRKFVFSNINRNQWVFSGILIGLAFISWYFVYAALYEVYEGAVGWLLSTLALLAFSAGVGLSFFLLRPRRLALVTYIFLGLTSFSFFSLSGYEIFGVAAFVGATLIGYLWVRREARMLIRPLPLRLIKKGLPTFFTGLALMLAIFYGASPAGRVLEQPRIPKVFFEYAVIPVEYAVRQFTPDFNRGMSMREIEALTMRETPKLVDAPPAVLSGVLERFFSRISDENENKTPAAFAHTTINAKLNALIAPYQSFLPVIFLIGLFFVFKALTIPLMWISVSIGWAVVIILLRLNVLHIQKTGVEKNELVL